MQQPIVVRLWMGCNASWCTWASISRQLHVTCCVLRSETEHAARNTRAIGLFQPMCTRGIHRRSSPWTWRAVMSRRRRWPATKVISPPIWN